jgi:hypothetical protein
MGARRFSLAGLVSLCVLCGSLALVCASAQAAAGVEGEWVTEATGESVQFHATVDPKGALTTYYFQYGPTTSYGTDVPAAPGAVVGSGETGAEVEQLAQGLQTSTTYHYRVVVVSETGGQTEEVDGIDQTFTTQGRGGSFALPDGRQYEMVSPPEKHGAEISAQTAGAWSEAATDGDALTFVSFQPTELEPVGFSNLVQNLSVRGSAGWSSRDLTVPHSSGTGESVGFGSEYRFFSNDLSHAIVHPFGLFTPCVNGEGASQPCMSPEASEQTSFLSTDFFNDDVDEPCSQTSMHCARPLVSGCPKVGEACPRLVEEHADVPPGTVFGGVDGGEFETTSEEAGVQLFACRTGNTKYCGPELVAATPDLSHVLLIAEAKLTPEAPIPANSKTKFLYEWSAGHLTFVGDRGGEGSLVAGGVDPLSADGSRVVFHSDGEYGAPMGLLMRDTVSGEVVQIGGSKAEFQAMSSDGSRVFFEEGRELYVFESTGGGSLAGVVTPLTGSAGLLGREVGVSEDGSYVYFVSGGAITGSGAPGPGYDLYVDHYTGSEWKPEFIARLSSEDSSDWEPLSGVAGQPTRTSPSGQWLEFMSSASLTGYDNHDAANGRPDAEVYLYHAATSGGSPTLACASCDPTGARQTGIEYYKVQNSGLEGSYVWPNTRMVAAYVPGWQETQPGLEAPGYQSRYLSDSGRLFFNSEDSLVSVDVDGTQDVYQYEPDGVGNCSSSTHTGSVVFEPTRGFEVEGQSGVQAAGCVGLISSGTSSEGSSFLDASQNGADVFFRTAAKLVPQDQDSAFDVYDAHECTMSSPCTPALASPPPCETETSCRPSPSPQPLIYGPPASATFSGPGDITPPTAPVPVKTVKKSLKCRKGFAQKHGRCVREKARKARVGDHGRAKR